jgi:hypothetical protein
MVWDRFFTTNLGFGIGVVDRRDDGARVFGLVSNSWSEPVVLLSEDAVVALIAVREGRLPTKITDRQRIEAMLDKAQIGFDRDASGRSVSAMPSRNASYVSFHFDKDGNLVDVEGES